MGREQLPYRCRQSRRSGRDVAVHGHDRSRRRAADRTGLRRPPRPDRLDAGRGPLAGRLRPRSRRLASGGLGVQPGRVPHPRHAGSARHAARRAGDPRLAGGCHLALASDPAAGPGLHRARSTAFQRAPARCRPAPRAGRGGASAADRSRPGCTSCRPRSGRPACAQSGLSGRADAGGSAASPAAAAAGAGTIRGSLCTPAGCHMGRAAALSAATAGAPGRPAARRRSADRGAGAGQCHRRRCTPAGTTRAVVAGEPQGDRPGPGARRAPCRVAASRTQRRNAVDDRPRQSRRRTRVGAVESPARQHPASWPVAAPDRAGLRRYTAPRHARRGPRSRRTHGFSARQTRTDHRCAQSPLDRLGHRQRHAPRGRRTGVYLCQRQAQGSCRRGRHGLRLEHRPALRRGRRRADRSAVSRAGAALGRTRYSGALDRLRAARGTGRRVPRWPDARGLPYRPRHLELQPGSAGQGRTAADEGPQRFDPDAHLSGRRARVGQLQRDGPGQGQPRIERALSRLQPRTRRHARQCHLGRTHPHPRRLRRGQSTQDAGPRRRKGPAAPQRQHRRGRQCRRVPVLGLGLRHHRRNYLRRCRLQHPRHDRTLSGRGSAAEQSAPRPAAASHMRLASILMSVCWRRAAMKPLAAACA